MFNLYIITLIIISVLVYLMVDYRGPKHIILRPDNAFNMKCLKAKELIVQEFDLQGNLWASRGLLLYRMKKGDDKFIRVAHVPTGYSYFWLNNFTLFRRFTNKPECLEATISGNGDICALSAGFMWHSSDNRINFKKTMRLTHYGVGVGRGILSNGLLSVDNNLVFWGEYFRNTERESVKIYRSSNSGQTWGGIYEYEPGIIRHIHSIQEDPYTNRLWVCTGDDDSDAMIGWSDNGLRTITHIGTGSQIWRTCQLVFTEDAVYWGTDTGSENLAGIYRWDKVTMGLTKLHKIKGAILFGTRLVDGTIVFSTDREGFPNERDNKARLFIVQNGGIVSEIECGTWKHRKKGYRYSFATLRIQRNQGNRSLIVTVINQKEFPNGELLLFCEENLLESI